MSFERNATGNTLHNHLRNDGFFDENEHTLSIIDDYHTKDITPEAIEFFREGFNDTGLQTITIYYQIKKIWDNTDIQIRDLSRDIGIEYNELKSFLVFLLTNVNCKNGQYLGNKLQRLYYEGADERIVRSTLNFISAMQTANITVEYQPYDSLNFQPPFHGRYWINRNKGYIVDGSLDTYTHGRIFAQEMDDDNFSLISNLMRTEVNNRARAFNRLNGQRINEINEILKRYYRRKKE